MTTAPSWSQDCALLDQLLDTAPEQRPALIQRLSGADANLAERLARLLRGAESLPDQLPTEYFEAVSEQHPAEALVGTRIGPYVVEHLLGEGGAGRVYRASRAEDFSQRVAIKVLRHEADPAALRRFLIERDALARLSHPHIVRLIDAGSLGDRRPYLILELIEGRSWNAAIRGSSRRQRVDWLVQVCQAVQHAHQHGLMHRDLKPGNVLVDTFDQVKLLDFGIARLLGDGNGTLTQDSVTWLTPAYAAPEQLQGEAATQASDLYALGLLCFETLSGATLLQRATWSEAYQRGRQGLPKIRAAAGPNGLPPRQLDRDLDRLLHKACALRPQDRYASAAALAEDLRAWGELRPISARSPSVWDWLRHFARRQPWLTATAMLAALVLALSVTMTLRAGALAEKRFSEARVMARRALFEYADAINSLPGSVQLRHRMIDDALHYLDSIAPHASNDASLWRELSEGYLRAGDALGNPAVPNLGAFDAAEASYGKAADAWHRWRALDADVEPLFAARLRARQAALAHQQGRLDEAATAYSDALQAYAGVDPETTDLANGLELADTLTWYGDLLGNESQQSLFDREAAATHLARGRALRQTLARRFPDDAAVVYALANSDQRDGDTAINARELDAAVRHYRAALSGFEQALGAAPDNAVRRREVAGVHARLAIAYLDLEQLPLALAEARASVDQVESLLAIDHGNDHLRQALGAALGTQAKVMIRMGQIEGAGPAIERQIAINQQRLEDAPGNGEIQLALSLGYRRLGEWQAAQQRWDKAVVAHAQSLALQNAIDDQSPYLRSARSLSLIHLGRAERELGQRESARDRLGSAIETITALRLEFPDAYLFAEDLADAEEALASCFPPDSVDARQAMQRAEQALSAIPESARTEPVMARLIAMRDRSASRP